MFDLFQCFKKSLWKSKPDRDLRVETHGPAQLRGCGFRNLESCALFRFWCFPQLYNKYKVLERIQLVLQNVNTRRFIMNYSFSNHFLSSWALRGWAGLLVYHMFELTVNWAFWVSNFMGMGRWAFEFLAHHRTFCVKTAYIYFLGIETVNGNYCVSHNFFLHPAIRLVFYRAVFRALSFMTSYSGPNNHG